MVSPVSCVSSSSLRLSQYQLPEWSGGNLPSFQAHLVHSGRFPYGCMVLRPRGSGVASLSTRAMSGIDATLPTSPHLTGSLPLLATEKW